MEPVIDVAKAAQVVGGTDISFDCASDPPDPAAVFYAPGSCLNYRIDVVSAVNGSLPVTDFLVRDDFPVGISYVATLSSQGFDAVSVSGGGISANIASLPPGGSATLVFRVRLN